MSSGGCGSDGNYENWEYQYDPEVDKWIAEEEEGKQPEHEAALPKKWKGSEKQKGGKDSKGKSSGTRYDWSHKKRQLEFLMKKDFNFKMAAKEKELQDQFSLEKADMAAQYEDQIKQLQRQIEQDDLQHQDELAALQTFLESGFEQEKRAYELQVSRKSNDELLALKNLLDTNVKKETQAMQQEHMKSLQAMQEKMQEAETIFDAMTDLQDEHDKALARIEVLSDHVDQLEAEHRVEMTRVTSEAATNLAELQRQHENAMTEKQAKYTALKETCNAKLRKRYDTIDRLKNQVQDFEDYMETYSKRYKGKTNKPEDVCLHQPMPSLE